MLIDFSKSFDTINNELLITKSYVHGVSKYALKMMANVGKEVK